MVSTYRIVCITRRRRWTRIRKSIQLDTKLMWEITWDGVCPAKQRCKCCCFTPLLLPLLHDWCHSYSYSTFGVTRTRISTHTLHDWRRYSTDTETSVWFDGCPTLSNPHTTLLTKFISSLSKNQIILKRVTRIRKWKIKTTMTMMMTQQQQRQRRQLQCSIHTCWRVSYSIQYTYNSSHNSTYTHESVWFDSIWFDSFDYSTNIR